MIEELNIQRDRELRRKMIRTIHAARAAGAISGAMLFEIVNGCSTAAESFSDEQHFLELAVDLENLGLASRQDLRKTVRERVSLSTTAWTVTAAGSAFAEGRGPKYELLADERL